MSEKHPAPSPYEGWWWKWPFAISTTLVTVFVIIPYLFTITHSEGACIRVQTVTSSSIDQPEQVVDTAP